MKAMPGWPAAARAFVDGEKLFVAALDSLQPIVDGATPVVVCFNAIRYIKLVHASLVQELLLLRRREHGDAYKSIARAVEISQPLFAV